MWESTDAPVGSAGERECCSKTASFQRSPIPFQLHCSHYCLLSGKSRLTATAASPAGRVGWVAGWVLVPRGELTVSTYLSQRCGDVAPQPGLLEPSVFLSLFFVLGHPEIRPISACALTSSRMYEVDLLVPLREQITTGRNLGNAVRTALLLLLLELISGQSAVLFLWSQLGGERSQRN